MAESSRLTQLLGAVERRVNFPTPPYVVALSGGADSATLAYLSVRSGELTSCLHVHHGLSASDELAEAAGQIAGMLGVRIETVSVEIPSGPSSENQARIARYEAICRATSTDSSVLLAHTRNDQAETVLLNLIRGAGTRGIAGIPYRKEPNLFRPLLDISRSETRELAALAGLPFLDDPSNSDMTIRRNRIRSEILPLMEEFNPNLVEALARLAGYSADDEAFLDSLADSVPIFGDSDGASVPASAVLVLPTVIQARVLRRLVGTVRSTDGVTSAELARIHQVLDGSSDATELESGLRVTKAGPMLRLTAQ